MLFRPILSVGLLTVGMMLAAGCAGPHSRASGGPVKRGVPVSSVGPRPLTDAALEKLAEAHAHYGTAIVYEMEDKPELALQAYDQAALEDPSSETLVLDVSRRLLLARKPEKALDLLARATALPKASAALYARLGSVYSILGKYDLAAKANRVAIRKEPGSLDGYQNLFVNCLQSKQPKQAFKVLNEASKVSHPDAEFLVGLAELYLNLGQQVRDLEKSANTHALATLERADKMTSSSLQLRLRLADGFYALSRDDKAAPIYLDLLKSLPQVPFLLDGVREKLANIYLRNNSSTQAAQQLEAIVRDNPTDAQAYYLLGRIADENTNFVSAVDYFGKLVILAPSLEAYYNLAAAQLAADQAREALTTLATARQKFPQHFALEYLSGMACAQVKDYTNALAHFTTAEVIAKATETNRLSGVFYFQFGAACERNGDYAQAESYFEKCLTLSPNFAEALNYLGYMWADHGRNLHRARGLIEKALKVEPHNAAFLDSMGWVLFKLDQPKEALDYILEAIKYSEAEDATLYEHLGDVYAALGQGAKAREAWQKSLALEPNEQIWKKLDSSGK